MSSLVLKHERTINYQW